MELTDFDCEQGPAAWSSVYKMLSEPLETLVKDRHSLFEESLNLFQTDCPYGAICLALAQAYVLEMTQPGSPHVSAIYEGLQSSFELIYESTNLRLIPLLNSRWGPIFTSILAAFHRSQAPDFHNHWPCPARIQMMDKLSGSIIDFSWSDFLYSAVPENTVPLSDWIMDVSRFAFTPRILLLLSESGAADECRLGALMILLVKLYVASHRAFDQIIPTADAALELLVKTGITRSLLLSKWPWGPTLQLIESTKRSSGVGNQFTFDLLPCELDDSCKPGSQSSPAFELISRSLSNSTYPQIIFVTLVWGRLAKYIPDFAQRMEAFGLKTMIFCLDDAARSACRGSELITCVSGNSKGFFAKFTLTAVLLHKGFDVVMMDFDVVFFKDPRQAIIDSAKNACIMVSRSFGDACMNIGLFYVKAGKVQHQFVIHLIHWLWYHPYDHDQVAFQSLLESDIQTLHKSDVRWPYWDHLLWLREQGLKAGVLDPYNKFVTSRVYHFDGWTGDIHEIVAFHFLDGQGGVSELDAVTGEYVDHWELFYRNDRLNLSETHTPLYVQDRLVKDRIMSSRVEDRPLELRPCITWDNRDP